LNYFKVVPETLEPSLQLAAAVLAQVSHLFFISIISIHSPHSIRMDFKLIISIVDVPQAKLPLSEIQDTIDEFRNRHLSELTEVCDSYYLDSY
jgi:hypothetical protein